MDTRTHEQYLARAFTHYAQPLFELMYAAHEVQREHHDPTQIQRCTLLSIKTGGCPEDCAYCPQSAHYQTGLDKEPLLPLAEVTAAIDRAKAAGAERFCMGAAWRSPKSGPEFDRVLAMVRAVKAAGMEACVTLGMLSSDQARELKAAGLDAYNHNLDTSRRHYATIIKTRTYDDRLETLQHVADAGISVCSGGIIGMGEAVEDRLAMVSQLAALTPQPESVPINLLVAVPGTPLADEPPVDSLELVRLVAVTRLLIPRARIRLSAGRTTLSREAQTLAFFAGANSIFLGDKLLTRENPSPDDDEALIRSLGPVVLERRVSG
jgi:biotin synthase